MCHDGSMRREAQLKVCVSGQFSLWLGVKTSLGRPLSYIIYCNTMSKPKFQTEWEEIDEEYQELQVRENTKTSPSSSVLHYSLQRVVDDTDSRGCIGYVWSAGSLLFVIHSWLSHKRSIEPITDGWNMFNWTSRYHLWLNCNVRVLQPLTLAACCLSWC